MVVGKMAFNLSNRFPVEQIEICFDCLSAHPGKCEISTPLQTKTDGLVYFNPVTGQQKDTFVWMVPQMPLDNYLGVPIPPQLACAPVVGVPPTDQPFYYSEASPDWLQANTVVKDMQHAAITQHPHVHPHAAPDQLTEEPGKPEKKRGRPKNSRDKHRRNRKGEGLAKRATWAKSGRPSKQQKQDLEDTKRVKGEIEHEVNQFGIASSVLYTRLQHLEDRACLKKTMPI